MTASLWMGMNYSEGLQLSLPRRVPRCLIKGSSWKWVLSRAKGRGRTALSLVLGYSMSSLSLLAHFQNPIRGLWYKIFHVLWVRALLHPIQVSTNSTPLHHKNRSWWSLSHSKQPAFWSLKVQALENSLWFILVLLFECVPGASKIPRKIFFDSDCLFYNLNPGRTALGLIDYWHRAAISRPSCHRHYTLPSCSCQHALRKKKWLQKNYSSHPDLASYVPFRATENDPQEHPRTESPALSYSLARRIGLDGHHPQWN